MQATAFEYRHRFMIHGLIYALCFAAPWSVLLPPGMRAPVWSFVQNGSGWFMLTNWLSRPQYLHFAEIWNAVLLVIIAFAAAGAALRTWGASYLGASTVQRGGMVGQQVIEDGPYRFVRNPLYLGTLLHSVALAMLMRPEAGLLAMVLLTVVQLRLIGREEPYLTEKLGTVYTRYCAAVPRLIPSLRAQPPAARARPDWKQGVLSEVYMIGVAITLATVGWSSGFSWESSVVRVMQGMIISLGISVIARALIPKAEF